MSDQFADILAREMNTVGAAPVICRAPASSSLVPAFPAPADNCSPSQAVPDVTFDFSHKALLLSSSLRQYARDKTRTSQLDAGIVAGKSQAGYLFKSEGGLIGEMRFATETGARIHIAAGAANARPSMDITISVAKNGREFHFDIEELAAASMSVTIAPLPALECARSETIDAAACFSPVEDEPFSPNPVQTYSSKGTCRSALTRQPGMIPRTGRLC